MGSQSHNGGFAEPQDQSAQDSQFSSADELITFARGYFASDFPNSERSDCPVKGSLSGLVRSSKVPDDRPRSHMFGCSECFREYRDELAANAAGMKEVARAQSASWWDKLLAGVSIRPIPIFAGAFSLLLLAFVGVYIWQQYRSAPDRGVAKTDLAPIVVPAGDSSRDNLPSASPETSSSHVTPAEPERLPRPNSQQTEPSPHPSNQGELLAMSTVRIDLENYAITRGGAGSGGEIKLINSRARLILALPEGSDRGLYTISIVDSSGNTLVTSNARSPDGKNLRTTLNVEKLAPQKYSLRVSRGGESPVSVPVAISTGKTVSPTTEP